MAGQSVRQRLKIEHLHTYRDFSGQLLGYVVRARNMRDGSKFTPSIVWASDVQLHDGSVAEGWSYGARPAPRHPYGAEVFQAAQRESLQPRVLLVEGERCQEIATRSLAGTGYVALSWIGGGSAWRHTDWRIIAEKSASITLWPDADTAGRGAMGSLATHFRQLGVRDLRWLDPDQQRSDGWDIADAVQHDEWSSTRVLEALINARPLPACETATPIASAGGRR